MNFVLPPMIEMSEVEKDMLIFTHGHNTCHRCRWEGYGWICKCRRTHENIHIWYELHPAANVRDGWGGYATIHSHYKFILRTGRPIWKHQFLIWTLYCRLWLRWLRWRRICPLALIIEVENAIPHQLFCLVMMGVKEFNLMARRTHENIPLWHEIDVLNSYKIAHYGGLFLWVGHPYNLKQQPNPTA